MQVVIVEFAAADSLVALKSFKFPNEERGPSVYVSRTASAEDAASDPQHEDYTS